MVPVSVATYNIRDKQKVLEIKTVNLPRSEYEARLKEWRKRFGKDAVPLQGNQPLNRTTKEPINAEEPFFESQLEKYDFAPSLSSKLAPGHRAVTLTLPVDKCSGGLIRANDIVDLMCTLTNENQMLNGGNTATIPLKTGVRVLARNNTTETADVSLSDLGPTRPYTIEVSPRTAAIINLAQRYGAEFSLEPNTRPAEGDIDNIRQAVANSLTEKDKNDRVSTADLAELFGIVPPEVTPSFVIDVWHGTRPVGTRVYPGIKPQAPIINGTPPSAGGPVKGAVGSSGGGAGYYSPAALAAASQNDFGFRPAPKQASCPTCQRR
jgi:Flp pilus assembly protein CpaB